MAKVLRNWACVLPMAAIGYALAMAAAEILKGTPGQGYYIFAFFAACVFLGTVAEKLLNRFASVWQMLLDGAVGVGLGVLFFSSMPPYVCAVLAIIGGALAVFAGKNSSRGYVRAVDGARIMASIIMFLLAGAYYWIRTETGNAHTQAFFLPLAWGLVLWVSAAALILADRTLLDVARKEDGSRVPKSVARAMRIAGIVFVCVVLVLVFATFLQGALRWLADRLVDIIRWVVALLTQLNAAPGEEGPASPPATESGGPIDLGGTGDGWLIWEILGNIALVCGWGLALLAMGYAAYKLAPKIYRFFRDALRRRSRGEDGTINGYSDSSEDLFSWEKLRQRRGEILTRVAGVFKRKRRYADCADDTQRLRYLYGILLLRLQKRERPPAEGATPLEVGAYTKDEDVLSFCRDYSAARYGGRAVSAPQVKKARAAVEGATKRK